jgi:hypothetical protein
MKSLYVPRRFCGPSTSANGGYMCGAVAALASGDVTVRLLKPPPLDTELEVAQRVDGVLEVRLREDVLAQARPGDVGVLAPPERPRFEEAVEASRRYAGFTLDHPAPACFVCGPEREPGDALCIFPGTLVSRHRPGVVAAPWQPDPSLDDGDGSIGLEFMWAALDCPGYHALVDDLRPMLLGELTARIERRVRVAENCVVVGWRIGSAGRKHEAGTALFGEDGELCGRARALWIEPRTGG